jgi:uncharacterized protein (DUF58 family)
MRALQSRGSTPGARFIDPAVLARISNLELLARTVVEGFINGLHRSPHLGASMDFAEHRAYMPGDDIRRIDWKLYARSDRYFIKEYEADTNANFSVLLDTSRSMTYQGTGKISKLEYAKYLAACLTYFSHKQRDRVGLVTFDDDIREVVPPSAKHLSVILHELDRLQPGGKGDLLPPLRKLAEHFRRRSMLVLISDLYMDPVAVLDAVMHLRGKGNEIMVFHLLDPAELDFPFDDATNFEDLETGERIPVVPEKLREKYKVMITEHISALGSLLGQNRIDYAMFNTGKPMDDALFAYLSNRQRLARVR